jgi:hypothetical protein
MSKLITAGLILIACFVGWRVFEYWGEVSANEDRGTDHETFSVTTFDPRSLSGMPAASSPTLEASLAKAQASGPAALREWIKACRKMVEDPRLAWIQLDYVVMLGRTDPAEAKKVFAEVKERIQPTSPIYPRIKQLERTYQ